MEVDEDSSWYTPAVDFAKHGITASLASGAFGIANTGIAFSNMFGSEVKEMDYIQKLEELGMGATAQYAEENRGLVDFGGFVLGSIVPGVLGVKALHMAQRGLAAANSSSRTVTGLRALAVPKDQVEAVITSARINGTVASKSSELAIKAAKQGFHQQFLEAAFAETAVLLTMNQHSMINDGDLDYLDSISNNLSSLALGTALGGAIGGAAVTVAKKLEMQAAIRTMMGESRNDMDLSLSASNLAVDAGDHIAQAIGTLAKTKERLAGPLDNQLVRNELLKTEQAAKVAIGKSIREAAQSSVWAGSEDYGAHISLKLTQMATEGDADKAIRGFVGMTKIKGVSEQFTVFEPRAEASYLHASSDDFAATVREYFPQMTAQEAKDYAVKHFRSNAGVAVMRGQNEIGFANVMDVNRTAEQKLFTLRHEVGHLTGFQLARRLEADELGKTVHRQLIQASRQARPSSWAIVDEGRVRIKELEALLPDLEVGSPRYKDITDEILEYKQWEEYLMKPDELLADSLARFTSKDYELVAKEFPELDSLFRSNNALRAKMRETDTLMDLESGDIFKQVDRQPTIADMGKYRMQGNRIFVDYAKETRLYEGLDKPLDVMKDSPQLASAKYLWAKKNLLTEDTSVFKVAPEDFVGIYRAMESVKAGWRGKVVVDNFDPLTNLRTVMEEYDMADWALNMRYLKQATLERKAEVSGRLRKANIDGKEKPASFSETDLARLLDTDVTWQQYYAMQRLRGDTTENLGNGFWSDTYNPEQPTMVRMTYSRELDAPQTDGDVRSALDAKKRIDMVREVAQNQIRSFEAAAFKGAKYSMPPTTLEAGTNRYRGTAATDDTQGFLGTQQGQYGSDVEHANAAGRALGIKHAHVNKQQSEILEPAIHAVNRDVQAQSELAVSTSKFRQYKMEEIPPEWKFTGMEAQGGAVRIWFNRMAQSIVGEDSTAMIIAQDKAKRIDAVLAKLTDHATGEGSLKTVSYDLLKKLEDYALSPRLEKGMAAELDEMVKYHTATVQHPAVANFWRAAREANQITVKGAQLSASLRGKSANWNANQFYPGTLDRELYKVVHFVKSTKPGLMGDKDFMIVGGPTAAVADEKISMLRTRYGDDVEVITVANNAERHKQLLQDYEDGLDIDSFYMDHSKMNLGKAADIMPDPNPQLAWSVLESYKRQARGVLTNLQKQYYDEEWQTLETLRTMHDNSLGNMGTKSTQANVFEDRQATMLNMPNDKRFKSWREGQRSADQIFSSVYNTLITAPARALGIKSADGVLANYQEMNRLAEKYGLPQPYTPDLQDYMVRSQKVNNQLLASAVPKLNWIGATFTLRLDLIQPIINAISLPILASPEIKHLVDALPELRKQQLASSLTVQAKDKAGQVIASEMSNGKLMSQATVNWFKNPDLHERYQKLGIIGERAQLYMNAVDASALAGQKLVTDSASALAGVSDAMSKAEKFLTKFGDSTEDYVRFTAADMARQVLEAGGITGKTADLAIQTYVNRVTGNYHYAQRPAMFQGWAGQAAGLFQTYQFNLIQQMLRHLGEKPSRAAAMMGLQTGIFGMQSTPGFELLNNHVAERSNYEGDFYTGITEATGSAADWILYGVASNFTRPLTGDGVDFFSRGNLNPRSPILIPASIDEVPIYSMATKFLGSMGQAANNLAGGVPVWDTFTQFLATNGVNRPLQGIGQLMAGERITSQGSTLLSTSDLDYFQMGARVMGARGMDEAVAVANYYRSVKYDAARQDKLESLGQVVKAHVNAGSFDGEEYSNFMQRYTETGGSIDKYDKWAQGLYRSATESQIQQMYQKNDSVEGRYMQKLMGAGVEQYINPWNVPEQ